MDIERFEHIAECVWRMPPRGAMRVPGMVYADAALGIVEAAHAMPDAHWGYGFPIGGVAAFDAEAGGIVSAGGVGFDVSCGVRLLLTGLERAETAAADLHQGLKRDTRSKSAIGQC